MRYNKLEFLVCAYVFEAAMAAEHNLSDDLRRARMSLADYLDTFHQPMSWRRLKSPFS